MQHKSKLSPRQSETVLYDALPESPEKLRDELSTIKISKRRKRNRRRSLVSFADHRRVRYAFALAHGDDVFGSRRI